MISFKKFKYLRELFDNDLGAGNDIHASLPRTEVQMSNFNENENFDDNKLHDELLDHYKPQTLSNMDKKTIKNYTHHGSHDINNQLWNRHKKIDDGSRLKPDISRLDRIIGSHKAPKTFHVYSSTIHDPEKLKNSEGIVHHPAFLSTSHRKHVALTRDINSVDDKNGDSHLHIIHFDIPKDHPSLYVSHPDIAKFMGERETILPRGLNLKHLSTETKSRKGWNSNQGRTNTTHYHYHHMEIVK